MNGYARQPQQAPGSVVPARTTISPGVYQGKQQMLADALMRSQQAAQQGPQDIGAQVGQAINTIGTSYLAGQNMRAGQAERDQANTGAKAALAAALRGEPLDAGALDVIGSEWVDPGYQQAIGTLLAQQMKPAAEQDLVQAVGPDGNMIYVPKSQAAGMQSALPKGPEAPNTVGGMMWDEASGGYVPIPGYAEQAERIAAAGRAPQQLASTNLLTLVGPDGKTISVDSRSPDVQTLLQQGYVERQPSMFPAAPNGYTYGPPDASGAPTLVATKGGPADPASKPPTEDQNRQRELYQVAEPALKTALETYDELTKPVAQGLSVLPGSNAVQSEGYQRGRNAVRAIVAAWLYSSSGATANPAEIDTQTDILMPKFGDKPGNIADKKAQIANYVDSIRTRAYGSDSQGAPLAVSPPSAGAPASAVGDVDYSKMSDQELLDYIKAHPNG